MELSHVARATDAPYVRLRKKVLNAYSLVADLVELDPDPAQQAVLAAIDDLAGAIDGARIGVASAAVASCLEGRTLLALSPHLGDGELLCTVCMGEGQGGVLPSITMMHLKCESFFCKGCLAEHVARTPATSKARCPVCRAVLRSTDVMRAQPVRRGAARFSPYKRSTPIDIASNEANSGSGEGYSDDDDDDDEDDEDYLEEDEAASAADVSAAEGALRARLDAHVAVARRARATLKDIRDALHALDLANLFPAVLASLVDRFEALPEACVEALGGHLFRTLHALKHPLVDTTSAVGIGTCCSLDGDPLVMHATCGGAMCRVCLTATLLGPDAEGQCAKCSKPLQGCDLILVSDALRVAS
jgi:hypothetical protein